MVAQFPATSAKEIIKHFEDGTPSNYAYLINAQPLAENAAAFCLCLYGTNNKFSALNVASRWKVMEKEAADHGIKIMGYGSDGDTRLLNSMQNLSFTNSELHQKWPWIVGHLDGSACCIQDHIHIGTKLRTRFLTPSILLPMGDHVVSPGHVKELINSVSKDQHNLTESDLSPDDKMNFRSMEKMYQESVVKLLQERVVGSEATVTYLNMTREILSSYLDKTISPETRLVLIWKWTFFLRIWKEWLLKNGYSIQDNFITSNTYMCVEVNAHSLIKMMMYFRDTNQEELFMPWLCHSQHCEKCFRHLRALTSTGSTVVNFSILDMLYRLRRIEFQMSFEDKYGDQFCFYKTHRQSRKGYQTPVFFPLPNDNGIELAVLQGREMALEIAKSLGMFVRSVPKPDFSFTSFRVEEDIEEENGLFCFNDSDTDEESENDDSEPEDVNEDLSIVSSGALGIKSFEHLDNVDLSPNSIFCEVLDGNGKRAVIKKVTLCYQLSTESPKISADRTLRYQAPEVKKRKENFVNNHVAREDSLSEGEWCVFATPDRKSFLIGRVQSFGYLNGGNKKSLQYSRRTVPVECPSNSSGRGIGVLCDWFAILPDNSLCLDKTFCRGFCCISNYVCTIPRPISADGKLHISSRIKSSIKQEMKRSKN